MPETLMDQLEVLADKIEQEGDPHGEIAPALRKLFQIISRLEKIAITVIDFIDEIEEIVDE